MKKLLLLLLSAIVLTGCSDDDKSADVLAVFNGGPVELDGKWKLVNAMGGFAGEDINYEDYIVWEFDVEGHYVAVVNLSDDNVEDFLDTGAYNYNYGENGVISTTCANTLKIAMTNFGCITIANGTLTLSQLEGDGYVLTFYRVLE